MALLAVFSYVIYSMTAATMQAQRSALSGAAAREEADRLYELVAVEIERASLATVVEPAPGRAGRAASFRRVRAIEIDPNSGLPMAAIEADPVRIEAGDDGTLVRVQGAERVVLSRLVTSFAIERIGSTPAIRIAIEVGDVGGAGPRASARGTVLVASD